ncbi:MAG TPA: branched-chain amino acid ABC transporter permease [Syntrophorhabdales bacterium]|nr:branched-chain amino acid ABC transporter permease [Syntrophorhabdales bacterium]
MENALGITRLKNLGLPLVIIVGLLLLGLPLFAGQFLSYLMLTFFAYAITVIGFNLLFGYTGLLSFGHALFMTVGAYTAAFLTSSFSLPYMELILVVAVIVSTLLAALIGAICVRYIKIYFAMLTLAFGMLFYTFLLKFYYMTGGDEGMRVLRPFLLGIDFSETPKMQFLAGSYYFYAFVILAILTFVMWKIVSSPFGLCLKAIRDNPEKAEYLGVSVKKYRWYAFVISAAYAAVGGALLAPAVGQVDPGLTYWTQSGTLVFMSLLGGFEHFFGPMIGGIVYILLQDKVMSLTSYWRFIFGAILTFVVIAAPGGIAGVVSSLTKRRARGG